MAITFKAGQVLFDKYKRVTFCPNCKCFDGGLTGPPTGCTWPTGITLPSCVVVRKTGFTACEDCVDEDENGEELPIVLYLGTEIYETADVFTLPAYDARPDLTVNATIEFVDADCVWKLTVICTDGATEYVIWQGEKDYGDDPIGSYLRTSGCDETYLITVN